MPNSKSERTDYYVFSDRPGVRWIYTTRPRERVTPYCTKHNCELWQGSILEREYTCPLGNESIKMPLFIDEEERLATSRIRAELLQRAGARTVRIDPDGVRVVAHTKKKLDKNYFVDAQLNESSAGLQLKIEVGKRDKSGKKVQLFVEPGRERLGFDHTGKDIHPSGIFARVTAEFKDSTSTIDADSKSE